MRNKFNKISWLSAAFMVFNALHAMEGQGEIPAVGLNVEEEAQQRKAVEIYILSNGLDGKPLGEAILFAAENRDNEIAKHLIKIAIDDNLAYRSWTDLNNLAINMIKIGNLDICEYLTEIILTTKQYFITYKIFEDAINADQKDIAKHIIKASLEHNLSDKHRVLRLAIKLIKNSENDMLRYLAKIAIENNYSDTIDIDYYISIAIERCNITTLKTLIEIALENNITFDAMYTKDRIGDSKNLELLSFLQSKPSIDGFVNAITEKDLNKISYYLFLTNIDINEITDHHFDLKEQLITAIEPSSILSSFLIFRGTLKINGLSTDHFQLTLVDIINQLENLDSITFIRPLICNRQYADIVMQIYRNNNSEDLPREFQKKIKDIFLDKDKWLKLQKLGFTELDAAFIGNNVEIIKKISSINSVNSIYQLGQKYRAAELNRDMYCYEAQFLPILLPPGSIKIINLNLYAFVTYLPKNNDDLFVHINFDGEATWDCNLVDYWDKNMQQPFGIKIQLGNGSEYMTCDLVQNLLRHEKLTQLKQRNLSCALVFIHGHDSQKSQYFSPILETLHQGMAKSTIVLLCSCYSGQYHEEWEEQEGIFFITTSKYDESSRRPKNSSEFSTYFPNEVNLLGMLKYCVDNYTDSTPCFSGTIADETYRGIAIKDLLNNEAVIKSLSIGDAIVTPNKYEDSMIEKMELWPLDPNISDFNKTQKPSVMSRIFGLTNFCAIQ